MNSDELLARQLQEEEERLMMMMSERRRIQTTTTTTTEQNHHHHQQQQQQQQQQMFLSRLQSGLETITKYEDELARACALSVVPVEELEKRVKEGKEPKCQGLSFKDAFIVELLKWFKHEYFSWCDKPNCSRETCSFSVQEEVGRKTTVRTNPANMQCVDTVAPSEEERVFGTSRVELYACSGCGCQTRFPRYNDAVKLLETRTGRCGEFANAFSLICRALDYETRYILDWTDHVWTEIWSPSQNRWIHCDSCEAAFDEPRLYSEGWGKSLSFVVAFSIDGVADVSKRYQKMDDEMVGRRRAIVQDDEFVSKAIARCTEVLQTRIDVARREIVRKRNEDEREELKVLDMSEEEKKNLPGRTTGSLEWRRARGELGDNK